MRCISSAVAPVLALSPAASAGDLLMDLDDALAEQVLDQMEDRSNMPLQQAADRGKIPVDVDLGPAHRKLAAFGVAETANREPVLAGRDPGSKCEFVVDFDHLDGIDREAYPGRERDQVVDGHDFVHVGVGRTWNDDDGTGTLPRGHQAVLAQPPPRE